MSNMYKEIYGALKNSLPEGWVVRFGSDMCLEIQKILDNNPGNELIVLDVKEKYGGMRFYFSATNEVYNDINEIIDRHEDISKHICVRCGNDCDESLKTKLSVPICNDCYRDLNM